MRESESQKAYDAGAPFFRAKRDRGKGAEAAKNKADAMQKDFRIQHLSPPFFLGRPCPLQRERWNPRCSRGLSRPPRQGRQGQSRRIFLAELLDAASMNGAQKILQESCRR